MLQDFLVGDEDFRHKGECVELFGPKSFWEYISTIYDDMRKRLSDDRECISSTIKYARILCTADKIFGE
ncbi:CLUMA_CG015981, isoform A [Clunio marinus]|uniref:CLUMA_CG015981, isoform A n=1 Tax=Clunio marinus TaxID=568069 RepID=A0A1J1IRN4_9DIPT|nr:CLUMA_CG015981, isoform A [Clunio marinus]